MVAAKSVVWLHGEVKSPPFSRTARVEAGLLLRRLQAGEQLTLPHSRPLRIVHRLDPDAVIIAEVFHKKTRGTPRQVIETCRRRLRAYDAHANSAREGQ